MEVIDHRQHPCSDLKVNSIKEQELFIKCGDDRPPKNGHIYMRVRPNASTGLRIDTKGDENPDGIVVVNVVFGTLHVMPKDTPVHRVHGEIHLRNTCGCRCGCRCCGKRRR